MESSGHPIRDAPGAWQSIAIPGNDRDDPTQGMCLDATENLRDQIKMKGSKATASKPMVQWRTAPTFYQPGLDWPPGSWLGTPGGYAVGHKVSIAFCRRPAY